MEQEAVRFAAAIRPCWQRATCWEPWRKDWHAANPAYGQCLVTSLLALEVLGDAWRIEECLVTPPGRPDKLLHYRLRDRAGDVFDPTQDQFPAGSMTVRNGDADTAALLADAGVQARLALLRQAYQHEITLR